jgi:hypothetical protein
LESPADFCDAEFGDRYSGGLDRNISVYRIKAEILVQGHTEHYAGSNLGPSGRPDLDLDGIATNVVLAPLADWPFAMTRGAHCEIRCDSDQQVLDLAERLLADLPARQHPVSKAEMKIYVLAAVDRSDPEWLAYLADPATGQAWLKLA